VACIRLLLVEDNSSDIRLMKEAVHESKSATVIDFVNDGEKALAHLRGEAGYSERVMPNIVVLDLNLPRKHGLEVLAEIRADKDLSAIPVLVMTTSTAEPTSAKHTIWAPIATSSKPVDFNAFRELVGAIDRFWLNVARLPDLDRS
jgi:two-component system, chemotaxis family, response regulator Rcp1